MEKMFCVENEKPIKLNKKTYCDLGETVYYKLLDVLITQVKEKEFETIISVWEDHTARDCGTPTRWTLQEYVEAFEIETDLDEDLTIGRSLRWSLEESFGNGGCAEILVCIDGEEFAVYHIEKHAEYILNELFDTVLDIA